MFSTYVHRLIPALVLFLAFESFAATPLSFDEAKERLLKNNNQIQAALETQRAAEFDSGASRGLYLPTLTSSLGRAQAIDTSTTSYSASLTLNQNLFRGFADLAQNRKSRLNLELATLDLKIQQTQSIANLRNVYGNLLLANTNLELAKAVKLRRKDFGRMVELRYTGGRENYGSVLLSKANLQQADVDLLEASQSINQIRRSLAELLGIEGAGDFDLSTGFDTIARIAPPKLSPALDSTLPQLRLSKRAELGHSELHIAESAFYPQLGVSVDYGRRGSQFFPAEASTSVLANLSLNLFNGTRDYYNYRQAKALDHSTQLTLTHELNNLKQALEQDLENFTLAEANFHTSESYLKASQIRVEIARKKYNNGLLSFDDLDLIETDLISREKYHLQSQREWLAKLTKLEAQFDLQGSSP